MRALATVEVSAQNKALYRACGSRGIALVVAGSQVFTAAGFKEQSSRSGWSDELDATPSRLSASASSNSLLA